MAHDKEKWREAKAMFALGIPYEAIVKQTGISKGQISKKASAQKWEKETDKIELKTEIVGLIKEKETIEAKKETLIEKVSLLDNLEISILSKAVMDETKTKDLFYTNQQLIIARKNAMLAKGTKKRLVQVTNYDDKGKPLLTTQQEVDVELAPQDLKILSESTKIIGEGMGYIEKEKKDGPVASVTVIGLEWMK